MEDKWVRISFTIISGHVNFHLLVYSELRNYLSLVLVASGRLAKNGASLLHCSDLFHEAKKTKLHGNIHEFSVVSAENRRLVIGVFRTNEFDEFSYEDHGSKEFLSQSIFFSIFSRNIR